MDKMLSLGAARSRRRQRQSLLCTSVNVVFYVLAAAQGDEIPEHHRDATALDLLGLLPELHIRGMRLQHVFTAERTKSGQYRDEFRHVQVPHDYVNVATGRRLGAQGRRTTNLMSNGQNAPTAAGPAPFTLTAVPTTPVDWTMQRDTVRLLAAINAVSIPDAAYMRWNYSNALKAARTAGLANLNDALGVSYPNVDAGATLRFFFGKRGELCTGQGEDEEQCNGDFGVAMSVYQDANYKILVFHDGWDAGDMNYIRWSQRVWLVDRFEYALKMQWTGWARQNATTDMMSRKGEWAEQLLSVCAFKEAWKEPFPTRTELNAFVQEPTAIARSFKAEELKLRGFWYLVKKMVREVLPEDRNVQNEDRTIFLTGHGSGGTWSAIVSMWLAKKDRMAYGTYVFGPRGGWQCLSRGLYSDDMEPFQPHTQIKVYAHVMDAYAGSIDIAAAQTCLYGLEAFQSLPARQHCSKMIGYTGPQLFHTVNEGEVDYTAARQAWRDCHNWTHSIWYAAHLLQDTLTLFMDGTTDGGCYRVEPVPRVDSFAMCPSIDKADHDCTPIADNTLGIPYVQMAAVAGGLITFIVCSALGAVLLLKKAQDTTWMYGSGKKNAKKDKVTDRNADARERAKERLAMNTKAQKLKEKKLAQKANQPEEGDSSSLSSNEGEVSALNQGTVYGKRSERESGEEDASPDDVKVKVQELEDDADEPIEELHTNDNAGGQDDVEHLSEQSAEEVSQEATAPDAARTTVATVAAKSEENLE